MGSFEYMQRRKFLGTIGLSAAALRSAVSSPLMSVVHAEPRPPADKIKVTGVKTLLVDNIPPFAEQAKWLFVQLLTDQGVIGLGERPT